MLVCFGAAWPFSIYKSYKSRTNKGKSLLFMAVVLVGYVSGIMHKMFYNMDIVLWLYVLNAALVAADLGLYFRNRNILEGERT